jgi:hypothetical protein
MRVVTAAVIALFSGLAISVPASAQSAAGAANGAANETMTFGTIVSSTRTTLVVRTAEAQYKLFEMTSNTLRPTTLPEKATVEVSSQPGEVAGAPLATRVKVTAVAANPTTAPAVPQTPAPQLDEPVPPEIRRLEQDIVRQTSRWRVGARAGTGLDPELVVIGAQTQIGPFFHENLWTRPNVELGFGEVTTLVAINLDGVYRVSSGRWAPFFGGGVGFNFVNEGFSGENDEGARFDFDNFVFDAGLNLIAGVQSRNGMFFELRAGVYAEPHLRFVVGYNFW